jgi:single-strand DNA-binding protein
MKYTPSGVPVASLRIAVNRVTKNEQGDYETDFFSATAWRRTAEFVSNYLTKGRLVSIDGRLQTRSWVDQASGQKRTMFEIVADNIEGLDRKGDGAGGEEGGGERQPAAARTGGSRPPVEDEDTDPFADD